MTVLNSGHIHMITTRFASIVAKILNPIIRVTVVFVMVRYNEGDYKSAFEHWTRAADLGEVEAHYQLSTFYRDGQGVEKDEKRELHHTEQAAIGGHPMARYNLGCFEGQRGQHDRATKHWIVAAKLGFDKSLECVMDRYKAGLIGLISKEDLASALRGHQAAIDATKSLQRDEAEAAVYYNNYKRK